MPTGTFCGVPGAILSVEASDVWYRTSVGALSVMGEGVLARVASPSDGWCGVLVGSSIGNPKHGVPCDTLLEVVSESSFMVSGIPSCKVAGDTLFLCQNQPPGVV